MKLIGWTAYWLLALAAGVALGIGIIYLSAFVADLLA